jgi:dinuclear metal center YbgI/SA1388 family protein
LPTLQQIVAAVERLAPPQLAQEWDRVGLQVDRNGGSVHRVMAALDLNDAIIQASVRQGGSIDGFIVHHPFIFKPLNRFSHATPQGRILTHLIKNGQFVLVAHTNLDKAARGINQYLAEKLGLIHITTLEPATLPTLKVVVFTPESAASRLSEAMTAAGAGKLGNYRGCSFNTSGTGSFFPESGAQPYLGQPGCWESASEIRLEMVVSPARLDRVLQAVYDQHPYEEPAIDVYSVQNGSWHGLGRIGILPEAVSLREFSELVKARLSVRRLQVSGDQERKIRKVALCSGSGGDLVAAAVRQEADLYLTGELNYHKHWEARDQGLAVIAAGHGATEQCFVPLMTAYLKQVFGAPDELTVVDGILPEPEPYRVV